MSARAADPVALHFSGRVVEVGYIGNMERGMVSNVYSLSEDWSTGLYEWHSTGLSGSDV